MVKKSKKAPFKALKITLITILSLFILSLVASAGAVVAIIKNAPTLDVNQILTLNEPSVLYNNKDELMDKVITAEQRKVISLNDVPQELKNAFVSIEDERFYKHGGIDFKRITGSMYINIKNKLKGRTTLQGASTITQQLLKNTILSSEVSWKRKIQEAYLAIQLEKKLTKDQILEAYMNTISLGGNAYGVEAASKQYFSKSAKDLNLIECAFIAGVPQSPSVFFTAVTKKNPSVYLNRTKNVLMKMNENKYISDEQYNNALNDLANNKLVFQFPSNPKKLNYEYFSIPAIEEVKKDLKAQYHYTDTEVQHLIMYGGLTIYTTMDKDTQDDTQKIIDTNPNFGIKSQTQLQAAAVIMDYHTGEVKAIIGGKSNQTAMSYNRAASDNFLKPPGSTIKPLTVYTPAIDTKQLTPSTIISDSPLEDRFVKMYGYNPKNDTEDFLGDITLRTALMRSRNVAAVKIENQIGLKTGIDYGEKFGLKFTADDKSSIASLSIGQMYHGTNPLTMAAAYGVFGNNGTYTYPKLYKKVKDRSGRTILENKHETKKVLSPETAYIMYDLLKGPVSPGGTGPNANFGNMSVRGKTGTSGDNKDLWFTGLTPYYSASIWIGYDTPATINGLNSNTAAAIWASIMKPLHENLVAKDIEMPSGVVSAAVCSASGKLPTSSCYSDFSGSTVYNELFLEGTEPSDYCRLSHSSVYNNPILDNSILKPFKDKNDKIDTDNFEDNINDSNLNNKNNSDSNIEKNKIPNNTNTEEESLPVNKNKEPSNKSINYKRSHNEN